ncbi:MAG: RhuM family protein [Pseudonocardia sp.]
MQNKLLYAVTGRTAGELVVRRCDPAAQNLGLTSWAGTRVRKRDVDIAKNYLTQEEITELNQLTTRFLDDAEDRARRRRATSMPTGSPHRRLPDLRRA